jgi:4-aminobutyrate aminotransferase-like enzyme/Ser/Thr protein kinase RdoA (MazF antagonist)
MSFLQHAPRFDLTDAVRFVRELYVLEATAEPLPSERDQNFLLTTTTGERFVLKIANATEHRAILDAQNAALIHVAARTGICPRVVPTRSGELMATVSASGGDPHLVRLVTWLRGVPLARLPSPPPALLEDLGRHVGKLDSALAYFDHPAIHRDFHWDLANATRVIRDRLPLVHDGDVRALVESLSTRSWREVESRQHWLRRSAIHNDANDWNVLVDDDRVAGIIDFGDMVHSWTVADLAVAIAYAVLEKSDPLATATHIVRGYRSEHRLLDEEIATLFPLVCLRLCMSVCIAAWQQRQRPDDEYLGISQVHICRTLPTLATIGASRAENAIREACALQPRMSNDEILDTRRRFIGPSLSIGYRHPVHIVRGWMQYLFDETGRRYIDGYNNVPHVGHSHPVVVEAVARQMGVLNTNTRYLHENLERYAERLTSTLPTPLRVCYFVNSGSEANELALRLARAHTHRTDLIVLEAAYHGNTTTLIDISPYKFSGPGGRGKPDWVHVVPIPDVYRGAHKANDEQTGVRYAQAVGDTIKRLHGRGTGLCGYIAESCPSVGGQIMFPPGYLAAAYRHVRDAGGVCIADEVQTAYGRIGEYFYGFEQQGVVPDIVVLGKPIGNGYPLGAVVTTPEIATSFDNGMEFFSTFGGNTVSCAAGLAVLQIVNAEQLQAHALHVGEYLLAQLRPLVEQHPIVGDVRGSGLFIGIELVRDRESLEPATQEASMVVNRLRDEGILIGTDGPFHNVLKIRPPMPFTEGDADVLAAALRKVLPL